MKTSSSENRKHPSRLRSSVCVEPRGSVAEVVDHARFGIEFFVLILREVVGLNVVAEFVFALCRLFGSRQQLDEGGFACSIDAHESDAVAALDQKANVAENFFVAAVSSWLGGINFRYGFELCHDPATGLGLRE